MAKTLTHQLEESKRITDAKRKSDLPPFEELRRAFVIGRPTEVHHTVVSGVAAAQEEMKRLEEKIADMGLECAAQVALVVSTTQEGRAGKLYPVTQSPQQAAKVIADIAVLPDHKIMGLVYCVVSTQTADYEFWAKAFIKGREAEKLLDLAVADGLRRMEVETEH